MKYLKIALILTIFLSPVLYTRPAAADDFMVLATALCDYTKANDRTQIRKKLKRAKMKLRKIYSAITCNEKTLHQFAVENKADDVVKFYETKIKADKL